MLCLTVPGYAKLEKGVINFKGLIARPDGLAFHEVARSGSVMDALDIGREAGEELRAKAGEYFLD